MRHQPKPRTITPEEIELFSRCPRRLHYQTNVPLPLPVPDQDYFIVREAIIRAYNAKMKGKHVAWPTFASWLDKQVYDLCPNLSDLELFEQARKKSMKLRRKTNKWFHGQYLLDNRDAWTEMELHAYGSEKSLVKGRIDIVVLDPSNGVSMIHIAPQPLVDIGGLWRDMNLRTKLWLLQTNLDQYPFSVEYIGVDTIDRPLLCQVARLSKGKNRLFTDASRKAILHIAKGISDGVAYPSVSSQCFSCPYAPVCSF